jgi:cytoskeletal protein CcmA (bactofilin family)
MRSKQEDAYDYGKKSRVLLTISGNSAKLEGKFEISNSIEIDCDVIGQLDVDGKIIIQKDGYVNADVKTIDAEIIGRYDGSMEATGIVEIKETGIVKGNVKTDSLMINKGGAFAGSVARMSEEEKAAGKSKSRKIEEAEEI